MSPSPDIRQAAERGRPLPKRFWGRMLSSASPPAVMRAASHGKSLTNGMSRRCAPTTQFMPAESVGVTTRVVCWSS